jgi:hypothetical protein
MVRWREDLDELLSDAAERPAKPRTIKNIVAQAIRRCLPGPFDEYRGSSPVKASVARNVGINLKLYRRVKCVRRIASTRSDDESSVNLIVIEAVRRYLFFRAQDFHFDPARVEEATGYTAQSPPKQHAYDIVKTIEDSLEQQVRTDLSKAVERFLDSSSEANSLNQLMLLIDPERTIADPQDWMIKLQDFFNAHPKARRPRMRENVAGFNRGGGTVRRTE